MLLEYILHTQPQSTHITWNVSVYYINKFHLIKKMIEMEFMAKIQKITYFLLYAYSQQ